MKNRYFSTRIKNFEYEMDFSYDFFACFEQKVL